MKIVYVSDLHFEINGLRNGSCNFEPGDILVLAGDISSANYLHPNRKDPNARSVKKAWNHLKQEVFPDYEQVYKVFGNHTHYKHFFKHTYRVMKDFLSDVPNLKILENEIDIFKGVKFLGCTLWSDFENNNPYSKMACQKGMNDYHLIYEPLEEINPYDRTAHGRKITPDFILDRHRESLAFLKEELSKQDDLPVAVITHHCPTWKSLDPYYSRHDNNLNGAYASNLSELILDNQQIAVWFHGHTHYTCQYKVGNTWILSNQCGYSGDYSYRIFKPNHFVELKDGKAIPTFPS